MGEAFACAKQREKSLKQCSRVVFHPGGVNHRNCALFSPVEDIASPWRGIAGVDADLLLLMRMTFFNSATRTTLTGFHQKQVPRQHRGKNDNPAGVPQKRARRRGGNNRLQILYLPNQILQHLLGIAKQHRSFRTEEQIIFNTRIARLHASLVYNNVLCKLHI